MRALRIPSLLLSAVCLVAPLCSLLPAQAQRAVVRGRVVDSGGGVVTGARVTLIQKDTNVKRETVTNEAGSFEVPGLFPSVYRIEAIMTGFKLSVVDDIPVQSAERVAIDIVLEPGALQQTISVTAGQQLLDTANADTATVIDQKRLTELPLGQGNATYVYQLAAGANSGTQPFLNMDQQPLLRYTFEQFNGSPQGTAEFTLDGAPNMQQGNSGPGGSPAFNATPDVVQEVRVQTNTFDASVGHTGGSTIDVTLKGGTNEYHGTASGFLRQPEWNANSWDSNRAAIPRQDFTYRRWGFSGGGPVWLGPVYRGKDRTFFYYGFEKWSSLSTNPPRTATVPLPKQLGGDFSDLLALGPEYQLYDPSTGRPDGSGRIQRSPFPNNIIPSSRIDPTAAALAKLFPSPNLPGTIDGQNNFSYIFQPLPRAYWASTVRIDHNLSAKHKVYGSFVMSKTVIPFASAYGRTDISNTQYNANNFNAAVNDVWTISPSFVADFRLSEMRFNWVTVPMGIEIPYEQLGLGNVANVFNTALAGLPTVTIPGYTTSCCGEGLPSSGARNNVQSEIRTFATNFSKVHGTHSIKFGADIRYYVDTRGGEDSLGLSFAGGYTTGPFNTSAAPRLGGSLADFLLGVHSQAVVNHPARPANLSRYTGFYINDDWRVTSRLTVNIGLRYERESPSTERFNRALAGFASGASNPIEAQARANYVGTPIAELPVEEFRVQGGPLFAGVDGNPRSIYSADNNNFAPRIGMAYRLRNNTAVRAGYGIFYIPYGQRFYANTGGVPGFDTNTFSLSSLDGGLTFSNRISDNLFPGGLVPPAGSTLGLTANLGQAVSMISASRNLPNAYNQRWQFEIQQTLGQQQYKLQVRYVGNRSLGMPISRNLNALPNQYLSTSPERDQRTIDNLGLLVPNPFRGIPGVGGTLATATSISKAALLTPYPQFTSVTISDPVGWSNYHGLQVEFGKAFSQGFTISTNYTFSKNLEALTFLNAGDPSPAKAIAAGDRTHIWHLTSIWELPFGKDRAVGPRSGVLSALISGWQIQNITFIEGGLPVNWGNVLFRGNIKDIAANDAALHRWFNTDAGFERNPARQLASNLRTFPLRLANVRTDFGHGTDLSLIKNTAIRERFRLQIRLEAYNAFNEHFYASSPGTNPASSDFGVVATSNTLPRSVQLGLKLVF